jgi:hypothetical protein
MVYLRSMRIPMCVYAYCVDTPYTGKLPLWRGAGAGGVLAGTRRPSAAGDGVPPSLQIPPHTHILLARSPAPYSPFRRRAHSPTAFSGPMARPPPSPPRPPPSHMHAGWMVSATKTPTSSAPLPRRTVPSNCICRCSIMRARLSPPRVSSLTHARRMDGFCNQDADQLGSLAGPCLLTVYVGVVECAPASLPPASSSLTHRRRMDGFCNQDADQLGSLAGPCLLTVYVGVVSCAPASLPPASSSLTHRRRMDGFCNQDADQLGSLAGPCLLTVYVGVVECAPASPYTYSSSTQRFPDERTPIEAMPRSATSTELGLGLGLGLGLDSLSHSSSHALPFFSPPSFHTLSLSPAFTSVWWSA